MRLFAGMRTRPAVDGIVSFRGTRGADSGQEPALQVVPVRAGTAYAQRTAVGDLVSVKRVPTRVTQHAHLTPYRYERVVEGPKHYVDYPRANSAYVGAYGRNRAPGGMRARRAGAPAKPLSYDTWRKPRHWHPDTAGNRAPPRSEGVWPGESGARHRRLPSPQRVDKQRRVEAPIAHNDLKKLFYAKTGSLDARAAAMVAGLQSPMDSL